MNSSPSEQSIFAREVRPHYQAIGAVVLNLIAMGFVRLIYSKETLEIGVVYWEASFSVLLVFMLFNSVFSIPFENRMVYFRDSIFCFLGVAFLSGFLAQTFSSISMDEAGSFRWLYIVFTFTYLIFISIVNLMRKIMEIAKRQDARLRGEE